MYCRFFGFRRNPFSLIAQANGGYLPASHQLILDQLVKTLDKTTGILCLLGPVGVGKSTLIKKMIADCNDQNSGLLFKELDASDLSSTEQLSKFTPDTPDNATNNSKPELAGELTNSDQSRPKTIYLLDNADSVSDDFLERLFTNVAECNVTKNPVLLILVGSSLLESQLKSPQFDFYKSLLIGSFNLERLDHRAVNDYILHRLHLAAYAGETLFDDSAIQTITKLSKGIPRVINTLCGNSLFQASLSQQHIITEETVNSAAEFCILEKDNPKEKVSMETPDAASSNPLANKVLELPDEFITQSLQQVAQMLAESGQTQDPVDSAQDTPFESVLEQQPDAESQRTIVKPVEWVVPKKPDASNINSQEIIQDAESKVSPIKVSNDTVVSSQTTETKLVTKPNRGSNEIPEIPSHSTDRKYNPSGHKKSLIAAAALLSVATIIWVVGQQPTKQSNFDVAHTDKNIQTEAHGQLETIHDPEKSLEIANVAPLDTTGNSLNSTETKSAQIDNNDDRPKRLTHTEQVILPAVKPYEAIQQTKTDTSHKQAVENPEKDNIKTNITALLAKARTQEDSRRLTLPAGDNAVETFRYLLKIDPDNVDARQGIQRIKKIFIQRAERLKNQGQWQKAEIATAKALQLDPENSTLANLLTDIRQHIASSGKKVAIQSTTQTTGPSSSSNLLDHQEQATKQRASARYQLAQRGITFNFRNFIAAAENGDNTLLQLFLDANMPINVQDDLTQNTALIAAAKQGHVKTLTMILAKNPNINWQNLNGQTALLAAAANGHRRIINHLLFHGANLHIRDNMGRDALMLAVEKNQVNIVKKLLARGASQHTKDIAGQTALSIAKNKNHNEIALLLQPTH